MATLPQAIQFARNYVADPDGWNAPWPDQMALILAHLDAQREALKAALPWLIKADNDGAFAGCALPLGGRKTIERIERTIAATTPAGEAKPEPTPETCERCGFTVRQSPAEDSCDCPPTSEPAICVDCGALPTDETGHESFCEREPAPPAGETESEPAPATFTAFCQDIDGEGTIWIDTVQADSVDSAMTAAKGKCAADWSFDPGHVHCLGIARGNVEMLHWRDIGEG